MKKQSQSDGDNTGRELEWPKTWDDQNSLYLLQEVALEVDEVVGSDDVGAAFTAEHSGEEWLHGWWTLPGTHHGIGNLQR